MTSSTGSVRNWFLSLTASVADPDPFDADRDPDHLNVDYDPDHDDADQDPDYLNVDQDSDNLFIDQDLGSLGCRSGSEPSVLIFLIQCFL